VRATAAHGIATHREAYAAGRRVVVEYKVDPKVTKVTYAVVQDHGPRVCAHGQMRRRTGGGRTSRREDRRRGQRRRRQPRQRQPPRRRRPERERRRE
jgi:hypothetical protein